MSTSEAIQPSRRAGFDVILGNPPWERVKLQEQEFFAQRDPAIATAPNAATRKKAVAALKNSNPTLLREFEIANRRAEGESHLLRSAGRYPLCGRGDINTYAVFAESMRAALSAHGRLGVILPTGVATDDTTRFYFGDLVTKQNLVSLMSFENEAFVFPAVHHAMKFCLLTVSGGHHPEPITFVFYARTLSDLTDEHRRFTLSADEITTLSPNTGTCSVFRSHRDASLALSVYRRIPVLVRDDPRDAESGNPWGISFLRMFDMANDSSLFATIDETSPPDASADRLLPLLEAKMVDAFDHRASSIVRNVDAKMRQAIGLLTTADQHCDPSYTPAPRYWVRSSEVTKRLATWPHKGLIGFFDITAATNERTMIAAMLPLTGVGHTMPCILADVAFPQYAALLAMLNSFVFDYLGRQKLGGIHYTFQVLKQVPTLTPESLLSPCPWDRAQPTVEWIVPRVLELTYTSIDVAAIARDLGYDGLPFRWDPERRAIIRAELDAAFLLLYGLSRDEAAYILDTFTLFKSRDEERNGGIYKTKQTILDIYDEMAEAMAAAPLACPVITPTILPLTRAQIDRGRAAAYLTLLAATWNKPVERQVIEYALVLMLNDTVRARILAQPRSGTAAAAGPTQTRPTPSSPTQARIFVHGLDAMISLLNSNQVLRVTTHAGIQRIEVGLAGSTATQSLPQTDWAKAKDAVAAFEVLRTSLQRLESLADVNDLEFSVA